MLSGSTEILRWPHMNHTGGVPKRTTNSTFKMNNTLGLCLNHSGNMSFKSSNLLKKIVS
jgi:hypothetical protein